MPCPHFTITITQRSKRQSAVAGAAYQSGEPLFSEYDQERKSYSEKKGITYTEIMLPTNTPPEYADRATLWNSAEAVEKQWNAQLARRIVLALPREIPTEQYPQMLRDFCNEHFVSKGMCVDFAIHNKNDGNPHAHIMLTLRGIDENGKWLQKSRKVYDLDENGERIKLPSGNWKSHKENVVDWNDQQYAEIWRHGWETVTNEYLERANRPERVDLRSFERQGITDQAPTVHMGAAVTQMERRGVETNIGNLNLDIKNANSLIRSVQKVIGSLRSWLSELFEKRKQLDNADKTLPELLLQYMDERKAERSDWSAYGKQSGSIGDLKKVSSAICYLQNHNITSLETLDTILQNANSKLTSIRNSTRANERRMKEITNILGAFETIEKLSPIHEKYVKIGWKTAKEKYSNAHQTELDEYNKAFRYLKKQGIDTSFNKDAYKGEYRTLERKCREDKQELEAVQNEIMPLKEIRYYVSKVIPIDEPVELIEQPKPSIADKLKESKEKSVKSEQHRAEIHKKRSDELE